MGQNGRPVWGKCFSRCRKVSTPSRRPRCLLLDQLAHIIHYSAPPHKGVSEKKLPIARNCHISPKHAHHRTFRAVIRAVCSFTIHNSKKHFLIFFSAALARNAPPHTRTRRAAPGPAVRPPPSEPNRRTIATHQPSPDPHPLAAPGSTPREHLRHTTKTHENRRAVFASYRHFAELAPPCPLACPSQSRRSPC